MLAFPPPTSGGIGRGFVSIAHDRNRGADGKNCEERRREGGREATYQGYQTLHPIRAAVAAAFSNSRTLKWALKI